jgi:uncharacterized protein GlcG (DUF336 family)
MPLTSPNCVPLYSLEGGILVIVEGQCAGAIGAGVLPHLDLQIADAGLKFFKSSGIEALVTEGG